MKPNTDSPPSGPSTASRWRRRVWGGVIFSGGVALFMVLSASASYIAVPAAMRVALPEVNPSIYLTLSLGVTFPFNLTLGIPLYVAIASALTGG